MKALTLVLLSLTVGWSSAYLIKVPTLPTKNRIAPVGWVHIQKMMLPLFDNVCEDSTNTMIMQLAKDFTLETSNGDYTKTGVIECLRNLKTTKGFLPKGEIFTEYNKDHVNELKAVFELFYYAKDFDTFYRAAAWARQNINCGLFIDAIYLAIVNRRDMEKISVPAPYELMPNYFINRDVVVKASFLLTGDDVAPAEDVRIEGNSYILDAKYTTDVDEGDEDAKLAYFREDIGLNAYYFIRKLRNSLWLSPLTDTTFYGERMYLMMKQFAARYDLERYSNELPELEGFSWDSAVDAYDPMLIYSNGNDFDHRTYSGVFNDNEDVAFLKTIENNLASVVAHLRQAGHNKSQILNHIIELLVASDKSYETVSWKLLGYDHTSESERQCSVLEHYMTAMRDPVFWRINKKIVQLIDNALKVLPTYTRNELYFPGVEVLNVEIKKMMTSFDNFLFDVTDSLKTTAANTTFQVKIAQPRLNHKPFTIKLNISSLVTKKSFVKIYLGPKMMPGELALKKHLFTLLDMFELSLKRGSNVVSRTSDQMTSFSDDFMSLRTLKKKVEDAEFGLDALPLKTVDSQIGYPSRLILPKGLSGGLPLQLFVFVAPFTKSTIGGSTSMANMELNTALLSPGYPLDLSIETRQLFGLPNAYVKDIVVTHKTESKPNGGYGGRPNPNSGERTFDNSRSDFGINKDNYGEISQDENLDKYSYDDSLLVHGLLGDRPDFTYRKTNDNNSSNKHQYSKTNDYANKRTNYRKTDYINKPTDKLSDSTVIVDDLDMSRVEYTKKDEEPSYIILTHDDSIVRQFTDTPDNHLPTHRLLGERPAFTFKNKDPSSYTANKNQYRNKEDFTTRKEEYKKEDVHDGPSNVKIDNTKSSYDKWRSETKDNINGEDHEDKNLNVTKLPVHGLLGKTTEDYTVKKNKYEIKKDDYVHKAETKRIEFRKKAFDKKAKVGVLDYSLLEKPEDLQYVDEIDPIVDAEKLTKKTTDKIDSKNILDKNLNRDIKDDKALKEIENKLKNKEFVNNAAINAKASKEVLGDDDIVTKRKEKSAAGSIDSSEFFKIHDKTVNKNITKNTDGTVMAHSTKDKYISKFIKDNSEEIDVYDKDGLVKTINKNIIKNKDTTSKRDVLSDINKSTEKSEWNSENSFTKTINKGVTKDKNRYMNKEDENRIKDKEEDTNISETVKDKSIETYFDSYLPATTTERTVKRVSVYDYIFNPHTYFDDEIKVYE